MININSTKKYLFIKDTLCVLKPVNQMCNITEKDNIPYSFLAGEVLSVENGMISLAVKVDDIIYSLSLDDVSEMLRKGLLVENE